MPRRTSTRVISPSSTTYQSPSLLNQPPASPLNPNVLQLRRQWKWAAVSQFLFTFNTLFAMSDIPLADVENDLACSTNRVLSRIMQRLLVVLTQDRKISADNWQHALRKQYLRRNPDANPIGPLEQPQLHAAESSRASTVAPAHSCNSLDALTSRDPEDEVSQQGLPNETPPPNGLSAQVEDSDEGRGSPDPPKVEDHDPYMHISRQTANQINWLELPMPTKLESLYTLVEWQFQNPLRLRSQMKDDDENAQWRIEPIGYDTKRNAYWLIGADRLWIQRELPKNITKQKRKITSKRSPKKPDRKPYEPSTASKRKRSDDEPHFDEQPSRSTRQRVREKLSSHPRGSRAAKARANEKLDAQAKDLAAFQRHMATSSRSRTSRSNPSSSRPAGIRVSARLRGTATIEGEWQEIPEEWLTTEVVDKSTTPEQAAASSSFEKHCFKTGLESDDGSVSDLTELSDAESESGVGPHDVAIESGEDDTAMSEGDLAGPSEDQGDTSGDDHAGEKAMLMGTDALASESSSTLVLDGFVEWETICVTLEDWEGIAKQFEKATHYTEKALHKVLSQHIVPIITAELREAEQKRRLDEAVVHRKRSTRIALKELGKEEERQARKKREEEDEKMSRARRFEARQKKEEEERLRRENAREKRRKERELREEQIADEDEVQLRTETAPEATNQFSMHETRIGPSSTLLSVVSVNGGVSGSRTPAENWELDCEICHCKGFNQDDGVPIMCCGLCSKWQHIPCHDRQDALAHRPKRNWDTEEFVCHQCQLRNLKAPPTNNATCYHQSAMDEPRGATYPIGTPPFYNYPRNYVNGRSYQATVLSGRYTYENQSEMQSSQSHPPQLYSQQRQSSNVTFAHYQPQGGSFTPSRPTYSVADVPPQGQYSQHIPHPVQGTGLPPYRPSFQTQSPTPVSLVHSHGQWQHPTYPHDNNSHTMSAVPALHTNGIRPHYTNHAINGNLQMQYSQVRDSSGHYSGLQHAHSYQPSR